MAVAGFLALASDVDAEASCFNHPQTHCSQAQALVSPRHCNSNHAIAGKVRRPSPQHSPVVSHPVMGHKRPGIWCSRTVFLVLAARLVGPRRARSRRREPPSTRRRKATRWILDCQAHQLAVPSAPDANPARMAVTAPILHPAAVRSRHRLHKHQGKEMTSTQIPMIRQSPRTQRPPQPARPTSHRTKTTRPPGSAVPARSGKAVPGAPPVPAAARTGHGNVGEARGRDFTP